MKTHAAILSALLLAALSSGALAAGELSANVVLQISKGYLQIFKQVSSTWDVTNAAPNVASGTQLIPTGTYTRVTTGDVESPGWSWFRNVSATNNALAIGVMDSATNFLQFARLEKGWYALVPLGSNAVWATSIGTNESGTVLEKIIPDR
jgi:hypothetical protein